MALVKTLSKSYGSAYTSNDEEADLLIADKGTEIESVHEFITFSRIPMYVALVVALIVVVVMLNLKKSMFK